MKQQLQMLHLHQLQTIIDAVNAEAVVVLAITSASSNPAAGGTPSLADLTTAGVTGTTGGYQEAYEEAIAYASPTPTTVAELQAIIDAVNISDITTTVVDVTGTNGRVWMDRNLGALQQATM